MEVSITRFDRDAEMGVAHVGFYVSHPEVDNKFFVVGTGQLNGSDEDTAASAWIDALPRVMIWMKEMETKKKNIVGTKFIAPVLVINNLTISQTTNQPTTEQTTTVEQSSETNT